MDWFDYDDDGCFDLVIGDGHAYPEIGQASPNPRDKQINSWFHREGKGKLLETCKFPGIAAQASHAGREAFVDLNHYR